MIDKATERISSRRYSIAFNIFSTKRIFLSFLMMILGVFVLPHSRCYAIWGFSSTVLFYLLVYEYNADCDSHWQMEQLQGRAIVSEWVHLMQTYRLQTFRLFIWSFFGSFSIGSAVSDECKNVVLLLLARVNSYKLLGLSNDLDQRCKLSHSYAVYGPGPTWIRQTNILSLDWSYVMFIEKSLTFICLCSER